MESGMTGEPSGAIQPLVKEVGSWRCFFLDHASQTQGRAGGDCQRSNGYPFSGPWRQPVRAVPRF